MDVNKYSILPKMIVFDLDYTLWPMWVEMHSPPFTIGKDSKIRDKYGSVVKPYPEVPGILKMLHKKGFVLGIASRTPGVEGAKELVKTLGWNRYFSYQEIFPGCKITHFKNLSKNSKIAHSEMLFFDDEHRNIRDLQKEGVVSILVDSGVNSKVIEQGLAEFEKERSAR